MDRIVAGIKRTIKRKILVYTFFSGIAMLAAFGLFNGQASASAPAGCYTMEFLDIGETVPATFVHRIESPPAGDPGGCNELIAKNNTPPVANPSAGCYGIFLAVTPPKRGDFDCAGMQECHKDAGEAYYTPSVEICDQLKSARGWTAVPAPSPTPTPTPTTLPKTAVSGSITKINTFFDLLQQIIRLLTITITVALIGSTIFAGIQYTSSGGDPAKAKKAMARIGSNVVVIALFVSAAAILSWILPG